MSYFDGTFTTPLGDGPARIRFPFINAQTRDRTSKVFERDYVVLPGSYSPTAAGDTFPGDGNIAASSTAYVVGESDPNPSGGSYRFTRTWAQVPTVQVAYGSRMFDRPVMHDIYTTSASYWAVSYDDGATSTLHSARKAVSSLSSITQPTTPISVTAQLADPLVIGDQIDVVGSALGGTYIFYGSSSASTIESLLRTSALCSGVVVARDDYNINITVTAGVRSIESASDNILITGGAGSWNITRRQPASSAYNTESPTQPEYSRNLAVSSHGGVAGQLIACWNGDKLVGITKILSVPDANTIRIRADESPWSIGNLAISHVQLANTSATRYVNGPIAVSTREVTTFYLPGVTVTAATDIPLVSPKVSPVEWMGQIVAAPTWVCIEGSQLRQWMGPILQQTTIEAQLSDALDSVTAGL